MAKRGPADAWMLIGGYNVGVDLRQFEDVNEAMTEESHTLGDAWVEQSYVGVKQASVSIEGFYDDSQVGAHRLLVKHETTSPAAKVACWGVDGSTGGADFTGWAGAFQKSYERQLELGSLVKVSAEFGNDGPVDVGKVIWPYKIASATGATTGNAVDFGAETTGAACYLQYYATSGEANIRVMHSSDNLTFSELVAFTKTTKGAATGAWGAERIVTTGAVKRYVAIDITTASATGTGTTAGLNFMVGLARNLTS